MRGMVDAEGEMRGKALDELVPVSFPTIRFHTNYHLLHALKAATMSSSFYGFPARHQSNVHVAFSLIRRYLVRTDFVLQRKAAKCD
jgi:hypothetical protein